MPAGPRVIRRVAKMGKDKRPKVARDRKTMIQMERVKAQVPKICGYYKCPNQNTVGGQTGHGAIEIGTEHAVVLRMGEGRRMGSVFVPNTQTYHFGCVPPEARPLVRFFQ